jgi:iron complex outermembrane receptor protein
MTCHRPVGQPVRDLLRAATGAASAIRRALPLLLLVAAARGAGAQAASRQTSDSSARRAADSTATLGAVVVSASRSTTTLQQMPLHTSVIRQAEIEQSPQRSLDQLLRNIPGVNMPGAPYYTTDPTGHQTRIRGVTNSTVLVLLDGVPIHDPFYNTTQWYKVPLSSIQRVEVVRGGNSSLWGNLAVTGVVNVITKKPIDNSAQLDVNYQSLNTANLAGAKNLFTSSGLALRIAGSSFSTGGYQTTPEASRGSVPGSSASAAHNANLGVAAYYAPTANTDAFLRFGYDQQNEDIGGYQYGTNLQRSPDGSLGFSASFADGARLDTRAWAQSVTFDKSNGAGCYLASAASCNTTSTTSPLVQYANSHDFNPSHELGASAVFSTPAATLGGADLQFGVDYRTVGGEDNATTYNKPTTTDPSSTTVNRTNYGRGTQQFAGTFVQASARPTDPLLVTLSMRYDYWVDQGGVAEMTRYVNGVAGASTGGPIADSHRGSFNPSLSLRYDVAPHVSLRAAAYRSFRAPGLNNLYRSYSSSTSITIANPTLSPQTLVGGEGGADLTMGAVTLGATAFHYYTKELIASHKITDPSTAPPAVIAICGATLSNCPANVNFNTNGQNAIAQGVELDGGWHPAAAVSLHASYTYTDSHYTSTTTGDPTGVQLGAIAKNVATADATWQATTHWSANAGARFNGKMYLDIHRTLPQNAFTTVQLGTAYRLNTGMEIYGSVVNLTDVRYSDSATTSASSEKLGMPRAFTAGVRYAF